MIENPSSKVAVAIDYSIYMYTYDEWNFYYVLAIVQVYAKQLQFEVFYKMELYYRSPQLDLKKNFDLRYIHVDHNQRR